MAGLVVTVLATGACQPTVPSRGPGTSRQVSHRPGGEPLRAGSGHDKHGDCSWQIFANTPSFSDVQFLSLDHALAIDADCVWQTRDGGAHWQNLACHMGAASGAEPLHRIQMVDASSGWLTAGGHLLRTTDGGHTWRAYELASVLVWSIRFLDAQRGWFAGEELLSGIPDGRGAIYRTVDGGQHWLKAPTGIADSPDLARWRLRDIWPASAHEIWAIGDEHLLHSRDGGLSWQEAAIAGADFLALHNITIGFLGTRIGVIQRSPPDSYLMTIDGGQSWVMQPMPGRVPGAIAWTGTGDGGQPIIGWVAAGDLYRSSDLGKTWIPVTIEDSPEAPPRHDDLRYFPGVNLLVTFGNGSLATCRP